MDIPTPAIPDHDGPTRILLVEDEPTLRALIARFLRDAGYAVEAVGTGAEALSAASGTSADLVVSDLSLADTTGPSLLGVLRRGSLPGVSALYISGHFREQAEESGLLPVGEAFLSKPFTATGLREAVASLVACDTARPFRIGAGQIGSGA